MSVPDLHELSITRLIPASRAAVWRAWTERLPEWWAPRPWSTGLVALELRPGGRFDTVMRGPGGEEMPGQGTMLEVVPQERIVFTDAIAGGWYPQQPFMIALFTFADEAGGTRYTAAARHWSEEAMRQHEAMGFVEGWGAVAGQLEEIATSLA